MRYFTPPFYTTMGFAKTKVPKQPPAYSVGPETSPMKNLFSTPKTSTFACILLSRSDRLRLVDFPQDVIPAVHQAVTRVWAPGVQGQGPYEGGWEWKLSGRPCKYCACPLFGTLGCVLTKDILEGGGQGFEAIPARRLIVHVLHALASVGWFFYCSADLSKKGWDKDTLFFRPGPPVQRYFFAISFNESDKIRLIDSPNPMVSDAFVGAVRVSLDPRALDNRP